MVEFLMIESSTLILTIMWGAAIGCIYVLLATGLNLIFGVMKLVNFAHGEFLMLSMFFAFWLWALVGLDPLLSLPLVVAALAFFGLATHYGIIRHILNAPMLAQICATFGLAIALRSGAQFLWTPDFRSIQNPLVEGRIEVAGIFIGQPQLIAGLVCLVAFIALWAFVTRTETGLALQATAQDREAAAVMGMIDQVCRGEGHFLGTQQSLELMNTEYYYPHTGDRARRADWEEKGALDMRERARQRARQILETHEPQRIDPDVDAAIRQRFEISLSPELAGVSQKVK